MASWSIEDIPYGALDRAAVRDDAQLFYTLATASFVEITSDLYTRNLIEFFHGDAEVADWLAGGWEPEELQHGAALRRYVERAWPDFDWTDGYRRFMAEFTQFCSVDQLAPTRALGMAARGVVAPCYAPCGTASARSTPRTRSTPSSTSISRPIRGRRSRAATTRRSATAFAVWRGATSRTPWRSRCS